MKKIIPVLFSAVIILSCGNKNNDKSSSGPQDLQKEIISMQPGGIPTSKGGWTMTAKINGKEWSANSIISPDVAGRIAGDNNGIGISLPYDRREMVAGKKNKFSHNNAVDLFLSEEDGGVLGGYEGEMEITKADNEWAEGKFHLKGSSSDSDKMAEVTEGFFRISMAKPQK